MMKNRHGFTLIELVVVIVILGILATAAGPKFVDISSDAKVATIKSLAASLKGAADLAHDKAIIKNCENDAKCYINIIQGRMQIEYGYPEARGEGRDLDIVDMIEFDTESLTVSRVHNTDVEIGYGVDTGLDGECFARYIEQHGRNHPAPDSKKPHIEVVTQGC